MDVKLEKTSEFHSRKDFIQEYIWLLFEKSEDQGLARWIEVFVTALNEFDLPQCERLVKLAKRRYLSSSGTATILFNEALIYVEQQDWSDALSRFNTCLEIRRSLDDQVGASEVLAQTGRVYRQIGDYLQARGALLESLAIAESLRDASRASRVSTCLRELGQVFEVQAEYEAAKSMYQQSVESDSSEWGAAQSRYRLGLIDQLRGDYDGARQNFRFALRTLEEAISRHKRMQADIECQIGTSYYEQGDLVEAEKRFEAALVLMDQLGAFGVTQGRALHGLGMIHQARGDRSDALRLFEQAERLFAEFVSEEDFAGILLQRGFIELGRGSPDKATDRFGEGQSIFEKLGNKGGVADSHYGLGRACSELGKYSQAFDYFHQALKEYKVVGNRLKTALTLHELGRLHGEQNDGEAEGHFRQALRISQDIASNLATADCMFSLGKLYHERGDFYEAKDYYYPQSLSLYRQMNLKPKIAQVLFQIGRLHHQLGHLDVAKKHYLDSFQIALVVDEQSLSIKALQQLELVALLSKQYADARRYFKQEQQIVSALGEED